MFQGEDVFKEIKTLSGGELARVELTKLLLEKVNFLIMDEPTNHLDISSREALESALYDYDGTMLMVSHDRYFINKLADKILYLTKDGIKVFEGDYDDYLEGKEQFLKETLVEEKKEDKSLDYKEKKRIESEKRKLLNRYAKVEQLISDTENEIARLESLYDDEEIATNYEKVCEISSKIDGLKLELDALFCEWEELQIKIDESGV